MNNKTLFKIIMEKNSSKCDSLLTRGRSVGIAADIPHTACDVGLFLSDMQVWCVFTVLRTEPRALFMLLKPSTPML